MPATFDLFLYQGDSAHWQARLWTDSDRSIPMNLGGAVASAQIRDRPGGRTVVDLTCSIAGNTVSIGLAAASPVPPRAVWDLQLRWGSGDTMTVLAGRVTTAAEVTV